MKIFWRKMFKIISSKVLIDNDIRHYKPSLIFSPEDLSASDFLIDLASSVIKTAWGHELNCGKKNLADSSLLNVYPGEHYRLLSSIVQFMRSSTVVEIGTWTGLGTLALNSGMSQGTVYTYDIIDWDKHPMPSHFDESDFLDGPIKQIIGDLSSDLFFEQNKSILNSADIIFMDAPKDGVFEYKMLKQIANLDSRERKLLILDDIRFVNMIDLWRSIRSPKLDLSTFGHWSGTGLVDISMGLKIK